MTLSRAAYRLSPPTQPSGHAVLLGWLAGALHVGTHGTPLLRACAVQGLVGQCALWKRRPTRWLKGIDGLQDWQLEVYSHEVLAHTVRRYSTAR